MDDAFSAHGPSYTYEGLLKKCGTFALMRRLVKETRRYQRHVRSHEKQSSPSERSRRRLGRSQLRVAAAQREIGVRYGDVLRQIWHRAGKRDEHMASAASSFLTSLWDKSLPIRDERYLPKVLWQSAGNVVAAGTFLKAKFMLRPFIDELPDCEERGALRVFYSLNSNHSPPGELLDLLQPAYGKLHREVWRRRRKLSVLTDGAITPEMVQHFTASSDTYEQLLFAGL